MRENSFKTNHMDIDPIQELTRLFFIVPILEGSFNEFFWQFI